MAYLAFSFGSVVIVLNVKDAFRRNQRNERRGREKGEDQHGEGCFQCVRNTTCLLHKILTSNRHIAGVGGLLSSVFTSPGNPCLAGIL